MNSRSASRHACLFVLTGFLMLVLAASAEGVEYAFGQHSDKERVVFQFPGKIPQYDVERTGKRQLTLRLPQDGLGGAGALPDFGGSRLVSGLRAVKGGVEITLRTPSVGFVAFALDDQSKLVVDVFSDPLGARWKPDGRILPEPRAAVPAGPVKTARTRTSEPPAPAPQEAEPEPVKTEPVKQASKPEPKVEPKETAPAGPPVPRMRGAQKQESQAPTDTQASTEPAERKRAFYNVPYVFRGKVTPPGQQAPSEAERVPSPMPDDMAGGEEAGERVAVQGQAPPAASMAPEAQDATPVPDKPGRFSVAPPSSGQPAAPVAPSSEVSGAVGDQPEVKRTAPKPPPPDSKPLQREVVERATENILGEEAPPSSFRGRVFQPGEAPPDPAPSAVAPLPQPPAEEVAAPEPEPAPEADATADAVAEALEDATTDLTADAAATEGEETLNATEAAALAAKEAAKEKRLEHFDEVMFAARTAQGAGDYDVAIEELDLLLRQPDLPEDMAEEAIYMKADVVYTKNKDDLEANFDDINGAYEAAINHNLESWRVPAALLKRGVVNLKVGNIPEAGAFFKILREKYQGDPNVPLTYYYWGDHYFKKGDFQKAADEFQYLVQVYPDSKFVREASLGLARSLRNLGYDKQAFQIVDYIEKRWPRFYVEFPPFLRLLGDAAYKIENYEKAKNDYWTYYNIDPKGDEADIILARLGDIYVRTGRPHAAREMYDKAIEDFEDREGGLISKMRLAEEGIYDEPSVEQMFTVFERPLNLAPSKIYEEIVKDHPDSPLAPLAQLKQAMWQLWNNKYLDSLAAVMEFEKKFPDSDLEQRARIVGLKAFGNVIAQLMEDKNYPKIVSLWDEYKFVQEEAADLAPEVKIALGLSFWKRGLPAESLAMVRPFLGEEQVEDSSEAAMSLALSIYADNGKWQEILGVDEAVSEWKLRPDFERELKYAKALALENLGRYEDSRELWTELGNDRQLSPEQRAYAVFFLAQESLAAKRLRDAYEYAQDAYEYLVKEDGDKAKLRETLRILVDVTDRSARYREALKWATELEGMLSKKDPSWAALRYRMAGFYKKAADMGKWRAMLKELAETMPGSLYGRMAASDLQVEKLEQAAREYQPAGAF